MEAKTYIKHIRISPKKLRFIVDEVRKMSPNEAINTLFYSPKRSAKILLKAIKSAVDNAKKTFKASEDLLRFKLLTIEGGPALKRFRAGGKGGVKPYKRRSSHIKIILSVINKDKEKTLKKTL
jgi:large subunit ribosomal protein L22